MTTKDYYLSLNESKQAHFACDSSIQYNNLNLNHNNEHLSKVIENSKNFTNDSRKEDFATDSQKNREDFFRDKFMKGLPSNFLEPKQKKNCQKEFGYKEKNSSNSSTLSLHIEAYEKSVEGISDPNNNNNSNENIVKQKELIKKWKSTKQLLKDSNIKNSFEYPRQQKEINASDPEVMQFKASQKLLNPNQSTLLDRELGHTPSQQPKAMSSNSDADYTSAEEISDSELQPPSSSPPSSFEIIKKSSSSQSDEILFQDVVAAAPTAAVVEPIDEGPKNFQLTSIFDTTADNDESAKDVRLLRANFFSKPKSNQAAPKLLEEEELEVVDSLDDNKDDFTGIPEFAKRLFIKEKEAAAAAGEDGHGAPAAANREPRAFNTKRYARDRIHLRSNAPIRPEDQIQEGPHVNYNDEITIRGGGGEEYPDTAETFHDLGLLEEILNNLTQMGIKRPKKIQQNIIPLIMKCKSDIIASAPTGHGKTLSYLIPLVNQLVVQNRRDPSANRKPTAAILLQNHETAVQVYTLANKIGEGLDLAVIPAMGNNNMASEVAKLKHEGGDLVVGTTGRFIQYVSEKKIPLDKLNILVFDEADQFVKSKDWGISMETFQHHMPSDHRTFLFSATFDDAACLNFENFVKKNCWFIGVGELNQVQALVKQNFLFGPARNHDKELIKLIISKAKRNRCPKTLVFANSIDKADWTAGRLRMFRDIPSPFKIRAAALHSLIPATDRDLIFKAFILPYEDPNSLDVIVASDKICCGVSTPAEIVVNYDIPSDVSTYILRVGRTGRNGHSGEAYTFINSSNMDNMTYEDRKNLCCMLTSAKHSDDCAPFPPELEQLHQRFIANM